MTVAASAQVSWNAKAGMNLSNVTNADSDMKVGFNVGMGVDYAFNNTLSLQPSLLFTTKGATDSSEGTTVTVNAMYLELPILVAARFPINTYTNVVISAGPYLGYGVGGKSSISYSGVELSFNTFGKTEIEGYEMKGLKRFDAGLAAGVAIEFNKFFVGLNGEFGLMNVGTSSENGKNMNFYLGVGYKF
jgi:opacity protein-like surface antigen